MDLKVTDIKVAYGNIFALHGLSFTVKAGSVFGILGANGAGKSTILRTISGLLRPAEGSITFGETDLTHTPAHKIPRLGIAHVPEGRGLFPSLSILDNLLLGGFTHRKDGTQRKESLEFVLDLFPWLKDRQTVLAGSLSGGQQQQLAIGKALMLRPSLLLLDEPSLGLSPIVVIDVFEKLAEIHELWNLSILLVEQNAAEALDIIQEGIVVENGRVTFAGTREELASTTFIEEAYLGG
jgi:branched-chain amino acid transport system ATP-binding protein